MYELSIDDINEVSGGISDDTAWAASIGVSPALVGIAIAATGPIALGDVLGSYAATFISTRFV